MSYTKGPHIGELRVQQKEQKHTISWNIQEKFSASRPQWKTIFKGNHYGNEEEKAAYIVQAVNAHHDLVEALDNLMAYAKLSLNEITDQDTGWYYQLQGAIQKGDKVITKAKGGQG